MPRPGLYKWEDTAALDHKCGTCATVLSSPKAKKTCIGKHEEVCIKYHKTLHFIGQISCRNSAEQHDKRHREVATLIQSIQDYDENCKGESSRHRARKGDFDCDFLAPFDDGIDTELLEDNETLTVVSGDGADVRAEAFGPRSADVKGKRARKAAKRAAKSHGRIRTVRADDVALVQGALHPPEPEALSTRPRSRNNSADLKGRQRPVLRTQGHGANTQELYVWEPRSKENSSGGSGKTPANRTWDLALGKDREVKKIATEGIPAEMLQKLGVPLEGALSADKERKVLLARLCEAIRYDIVTVDNEEKETEMRMEGYWRYVNRKTYNEMVWNNSERDWNSGEKLSNSRRDDNGEGPSGGGEEAVAESEPSTQATPTRSKSPTPPTSTAPGAQPHTIKFVIPAHAKVQPGILAPSCSRHPRPDVAGPSTKKSYSEAAAAAAATSTNGTSKTDKYAASKGYEMDSEHSMADLLKNKRFFR
ncbi:MAG: hypothetical protein M1832_005374 [Thelocarpon impressellum]|nr:MAG: hypothetical protein M1832_005374 [Thelocarpon impressellum]